MRAPLGWLREYAALPEELTGRQLADALVRAGLEVETVESAGADLTGPVVVGRVVSFEAEAQKNGKTIRWCQVEVGPAPLRAGANGDTGADRDIGADRDTGAEGGAGLRGIVCGAANFEPGDLVVVALPGAVLPGDFAIAARKTYGHVSDGMICSARELGLGEDHDGILVLTEPGPEPGDDAAEVLHLRDDVLDIAVTPDRGYCLSIRGLAREAAQALGTAFTDPVDRPVPPATDAGYPVRLATAACPVVQLVAVDGIDPGRPSPAWLARRVQLAGMRSVSLAVDITNYVMLETGHPIHAYDRDRLNGPIVVRAAASGERVQTLDHVDRSCADTDLLIVDDSGPLGLAGVMGGAVAELSGTTTSVLIEAAHFDALTVARTSRRHKLSSEASRRYERGVDPAAGYAAAHRVAALLVELAGGTLVPGETVAGAVPVVPTQVLDPALPGNILGTEIAPAQVAELLSAVGVIVAAGPEAGVLSITPPTWRPDLRDPYDYVEEVGRLVGFDTIEPVVPRAPVGRGLTRSQRARRAVSAALVEAGAVEVLSFPFLSADDLDRLGLTAADRRRWVRRVLNPLSETTPFLRTSVLPGLFAAVARNTSRGTDDLVVFETGSVFFAPTSVRSAPRPGVEGPPTDAVRAEMDDALGDQPRHLGVVLTGTWRPVGWSGPATRVGWQHAVGLAETAARGVGLELSRQPAGLAPWHPGRCAELRPLGTDVVLGYAGELHPQVTQAFGLPPRSCAVEIDLDLLIATAPTGGEVTPISAHPVAKEDVALVVAEPVSAAAVADALRRGAGPLLESVTLFDIYRGPQIAPGHKSLAFALRLRAADRTLTDADAAAVRDAAVAAAGAAFAAQLRS